MEQVQPERIKNVGRNLLFIFIISIIYAAIILYLSQVIVDPKKLNDYRKLMQCYYIAAGIYGLLSLIAIIFIIANLINCTKEVD
jgi:hypothetical protein